MYFPLGLIHCLYGTITNYSLHILEYRLLACNYLLLLQGSQENESLIFRGIIFVQHDKWISPYPVSQTTHQGMGSRCSKSRLSALRSGLLAWYQSEVYEIRLGGTELVHASASYQGNGRALWGNSCSLCRGPRFKFLCCPIIWSCVCHPILLC